MNASQILRSVVMAFSRVLITIALMSSYQRSCAQAKHDNVIEISGVRAEDVLRSFEDRGYMVTRTFYAKDSLFNADLRFLKTSPIGTITVSLYLWTTWEGTTRIRGIVNDTYTLQNGSGWQRIFLATAAVAGGGGGKISYLKLDWR